MEISSGICYICQDKRRVADTDASQNRISSKPDDETFKDVLLRAISRGPGEEELERSESTKGGDEVQDTSANLLSSCSLDVLYKKVESDTYIIICRRCESLLQDFDLHEKKAAMIADSICMFLRRPQSTEKNDSDCGSSSSGTSRGRKILDEKQSILAAFRALRKSNPIERKRGKKRKDATVSGEKSENSENDEAEKAEAAADNTRDDMESKMASRCSKRIQRRREEGLVMRWGDSHEEPDTVEVQNEKSEEEVCELMLDEAIRPRKRRGRKPNSWKVLKTGYDVTETAVPQNQSTMKYQCPFCLKHYIPSLSRVHNCVSYKNQLRCQLCNIFFTSYIRLEKHLEVIHLKQKELRCPEQGCSYVCISQPALMLHHHFHRISHQESDGSDDCRGSSFTESGPDHVVVTADLNSGGQEITITSDKLGDVCPPDMVDQVSFHIDEKNLLFGYPVDIKVNNTGLKTAAVMEREVLPLGETLQSAHNEKDASTKTKKGDFMCPLCSQYLLSQESFNDHMRNIHGLISKQKSDLKPTRYVFVSMDKKELTEKLVKKNFTSTQPPIYTVGKLKEQNRC